jgi:signal transduction histidine kinase
MRDIKKIFLWLFPVVGIIVIPAICLIWFMNLALQNEKHAIRQRLVDIYGKKLKKLDWNPELLCLSVEDVKSDDRFLSFLDAMPHKRVDGMVVLDSNNSIQFPVNTRLRDQMEERQFEQIWRIEYQDQEYGKAAALYQTIADKTDDPRLMVQALSAAARCFRKANDNSRVAEIYRLMIDKWPCSDSFAQVCHAKVALADLLVSGEYTAVDGESLLAILDAQYLMLSSGLRRFMLSKTADILRKVSCENKCRAVLDRLRAMQSFDSISNSAVGHIDRIDVLSYLNPYALHRTDSLWYSVIHKNGLVFIPLYTKERVCSWIEHSLGDIDEIIRWQVVNRGRILCSNHVNEGQVPFLVRDFALGTGDKWEVRFYFSKHLLSDMQASRKTNLYLIIGLLTVLGIASASAFVANAVRKQTKLNKMKNDFLATVTHELKTPIASNRLLIETLIDGKVSDPDKVKEYYEMFFRENQRLGRLIDNFLTFSRMERRRYTFDYAMCSVDEIVHAAIDAMRIKLDSNDCCFTAKTGENTEEVLANFDAIVTVLTNLLDNAVKYSSPPRTVSLLVEKRDRFIAFVVTDNGEGIPKRLHSRIFDSFYQINPALNRKAEGCGLGLSIVKYLVEAHKGTIEVNSSPGRGSAFEVLLPSR